MEKNCNISREIFANILRDKPYYAISNVYKKMDGEWFSCQHTIGEKPGKIYKGCKDNPPNDFGDDGDIYIHPVKRVLLFSDYRKSDAIEPNPIDSVIMNTCGWQDIGSPSHRGNILVQYISNPNPQISLGQKSLVVEIEEGCLCLLRLAVVDENYLVAINRGNSPIVENTIFTRIPHNATTMAF